MDWQTLFFNADGRMGKKDFWVGVAIIFVINLLFSQVESIGWLVSLATLWASVCVYAKRLHDFDKSGWLMLLPLGVFVLAILIGALSMLGGALAGSSGGGSGVALGVLFGLGFGGVLFGLAMLVNIGFVIWVGTRDSDPEANRFGSPPDVPLVTAI
ncbi:MAG: DUF805 domain-containing protein [Hyphomonadaceae bacterium]|nr:DUF805 domain-containing protein [Hyphomonadaceae bacterium]